MKYQRTFDAKTDTSRQNSTGKMESTQIEDKEEYVKRLQNKLDELKAERIKVDQANELLQQKIRLLNSRVVQLNEKYSAAANEEPDSTEISQQTTDENTEVKSEISEENKNKEET